MGFFNSLKGKADVGTDSGYESNNTQYNSGSHDELSAAPEKRRVFGFSRSQQSGQNTTSQSSSTFQPPPGAPPTKHPYQPTTAHNDPPSNPPAYHDWTSVPDNSDLPPPPQFTSDISPINNAPNEDAEAADAWCAQFPPNPPGEPSPSLVAASDTLNIIFNRPEPFHKSATLTNARPGVWKVTTKKNHRDCIVLPTIPHYFAAAHHPLHTGSEKTIYFEIHVLSIANKNSAVAIGYVGLPYPPWRLPGWQRGSIGVHSDDGRRYINNVGGGIDFMEPLRAGETVGLGMRITGQGKTETTVRVWVFVTRDGRELGGWWVDEEADAGAMGPEGVAGLEGEGDLYAAAGLFGGVEFEIRVRREEWLYQPR